MIRNDQWSVDKSREGWLGSEIWPEEKMQYISKKVAAYDKKNVY